MAIKLKWKVEPEPTGKWRSFAQRGWPCAMYDNGKMAISLSCDDEYVPAKVKTGDHSEITVHIADYSSNDGRFTWRKIVKRAKTLKEAKETAAIAIDILNGFRPEAYRNQQAQPQ